MARVVQFFEHAQRSVMQVERGLRRKYLGDNRLRIFRAPGESPIGKLNRYVTERISRPKSDHRNLNPAGASTPPSTSDRCDDSGARFTGFDVHAENHSKKPEFGVVFAAVSGDPGG